MAKQVNVLITPEDLAAIEEAMPGLRGGPAIRAAARLWARYHSRLMDFVIASATRQQEAQNEERI